MGIFLGENISESVQTFNSVKSELSKTGKKIQSQVNQISSRYDIEIDMMNLEPTVHKQKISIVYDIPVLFFNTDNPDDEMKFRHDVEKIIKSNQLSYVRILLFTDRIVIRFIENK